jgi:flagellar biosynthesis protein FlhG
MSNAFFQTRQPRNQTRTLSITSGKGGVGKTTTVANLAYCLSALGQRVLILDGDLGMANVDIMFGVRTYASIHDVLNQSRSLSEVIVPVAENVDLIPGGSGVYGLHNLSFAQRQILLDQVGHLDSAYDYMLIDTAPGIDDNVLYLNAAAQEILVVVTPDPSSLTDAYAIIKVLNQKHQENRFSILCNQVKDEKDALRVYQRLTDVADQFLCVSLDYKGFIPLDLNLKQANRAQQLLCRDAPMYPAAQKYRELAEILTGNMSHQELKGSIQFFWEQLSGVA